MTPRTPFHTSTERLNIREFKASDGEFILELVNTPGWLEFIGNRGITNIEEAQLYLLTGPMNHCLQHGYGLYRVSISEGDVPIGMCGLIKRETLEHTDLGFAFLPQFANKGYALEAAEKVLQVAASQFQLKTIDAITLPSNKTAIRLLEKLNFNYLNPIQLKGDDDVLRLYRWSISQ
jgi:RimJ/RimL family protein N-acetyltransferase